MDLWMHEDGSCYPTYPQLIEASRLSRPTVNKHIDLAEEEGWILRLTKAAKRNRWRHNAYQATIPIDAVKKFNYVEPKNVSTQLKYLHDAVKKLNSNPSREPLYSFFPAIIGGKEILLPISAKNYNSDNPNQFAENKPPPHGEKNDSKTQQSLTPPPSDQNLPPNPKKSLAIKEQRICIEYLNQKTGKNFPTDKSDPLLIKIFNSGRTVEHVKKAIDNAVEAHSNGKLDAQYLSPNGLFNPKYFEHWLNAKAKTKKRMNPKAGIMLPKSQEEIMNAIK